MSFTSDATFSGVKFTFTPKASNTSALPHLDETDRPPCLATLTPALAATMALKVETLNV